jgi:hypothetical protein
MISAMILVIPGIEKKRILLLKIWMCAYGNSVLWSKIIHNICSIYICMKKEYAYLYFYCRHSDLHNKCF